MKDRTSDKSGLFFGSAEFSGIGGFQEKMLSQLLESGAAVRNVRFENGAIKGAVSPLDYLKVSRIAQKNGVRLRAGKRRGLYFTLAKYRTRAGLYVGFLVFVLMISMMKTRVLDIEIIGDAKNAQIMSILEDCGIVRGAPLNSLNFSRAEHQIMLEVPDCAWADVSREGFRVKVEARKGVAVPEIEGTNPRNIVASRPAVVVSQIVRKGGSAVKNGSGVNTGDLLVSGTVFDGNMHIMYVHSDAEIIGEFQETQEFFVPYKETVNLPKGEEKRFDSLVVGDDEYPLYFGRAYAENSVYREETRLLFGANSPIKLKTGIFTAYVPTEITRTQESCTNELKKLKAACEENFYSEYEITAAEEKYFPESGGIRLIVDYTLRGNIARPVDIELGENAASDR